MAVFALYNKKGGLINSVFIPLTGKSDLIREFIETFPKAGLPALVINFLEDSPDVLLLHGINESDRHIIYGRILLKPYEMKQWGISGQ